MTLICWQFEVQWQFQHNLGFIMPLEY